MSTALDLVLSQMTSSYVAPEPIAPAASKKPAKPISATHKVVKPTTVETNPSPNGGEAKVVTLGLDLPKPGTYNAHQFIELVKGHNVGWVCSTNPALLTMPKEGVSRDEVIKAIAGYVGWDPSLDFGTQDVMARRKAQQEINPALRPQSFKPSLTVAGLVAGMPDWRQKRYQDLKGRERLAVDTIAEHTKLAGLSKIDQDRQTNLAMAEVERERLAQIRKDLAAEFG